MSHTMRAWDFSARPGAGYRCPDRSIPTASFIASSNPAHWRRRRAPREGVSARQAQPTQPSTTKQIQEKPNKTKQKSLDLFGFIRPNQGFSRGYGGTQIKKFLLPSQVVCRTPKQHPHFFSPRQTCRAWARFEIHIAYGQDSRKELQNLVGAVNYCSRSNPKPDQPLNHPKIEPRAPARSDARE